MAIKTTSITVPVDRYPVLAALAALDGPAWWLLLGAIASALVAWAPRALYDNSPYSTLLQAIAAAYKDQADLQIPQDSVRG